MALTLSKGTIIEEKYEILELLGSGGYGAVYKAKQIGIERVVAIKLLHMVASEDAESTERFRREGLAMASFQHKNIPTVFQFGIWHERIPYFAMEYLSGQSLRSELAKNEKLDWRRAVSITQDICDAIGYAHEHGIVHRDLKPENIFLKDEGAQEVVKVCDFGLAKFLPQGKNSELETLTATGLLIGSASYMSPEQCSGKKSDTRSDIYSIACILFEMLTGQAPFVADNSIALIHMHINSPIPSLADMPELNKIIWKGLQKDPANRYQNMSSLAADLKTVMSGKPLAIDTASPQNKLKLSAKWIMVALIAFAIIVIGASSFFKSHSNNSVERKQIDKSSRLVHVKQLFGLADLSIKENHPERAEKPLRKLLALTETTPEFIESTQRARLSLADVLTRLNRIDEAIIEGKTAWALLPQVKKASKRKYIGTLEQLAIALEYKRDFAEAIKYRKLALTYAPDKEDLTSMQIQLANTYFLDKQYEEAKKVAKQVISQEDVVAPATEIRTLFLLAEIAALQRHAKEANEYVDTAVERAVQLLETQNKLHDSAFEPAQLRNHIAVIAMAFSLAGDTRNAKKLIEKSFDVSSDYNLPIDVTYAHQVLSLAQTFILVNHSYPEASALLKKVLSSYETNDDLRDMLVSTLIICLSQQNKIDELEKFLQHRIQLLPNDQDSRTLISKGRCMAALAKAYYSSNVNSAKADKLTKEVQLIAEKTFDPEIPSSLELEFALGDLQEQRGRYDLALPQHLKVLQMLEEKNRISDVHVVRSLRCVATCYDKLKEYKKAESYYQRGIEEASKQDNPMMRAEYEILLLQAIKLYTTQLKNPSELARLKTKLSAYNKLQAL